METIMSRKTLLTLSVSVTLATISLAPTAVYAQFPVLLQWGRAVPLRSRLEVLRRSQVLLPWGLAVRPMPASAVRLLGWAPALVLAAI
jgi:hypothetical protein